jgi:uncharacterized protein
MILESNTMFEDIRLEVDTPLKHKLDDCVGILRRFRRVLVAFSGGADSSFLLALAVQTLGKDKVTAGMAV